MLDTLPEDIRHALEVCWEERLAFDLLSHDVQHDCIGWIEETDAPDVRHRRIEIVLNSLRPSSQSMKAERRFTERLGSLRAPGIALGAVAANATSENVSLATALLIGTGNTLEASCKPF